MCVISTLRQSHRTWGTDRHAGRYTCTKAERQDSQHGNRQTGSTDRKKRTKRLAATHTLVRFPFDSLLF